MEDKNPYYDYKKIYNDEILPHILQIKKICALNKFPCFTCVAVSNSEKGTEYKYDGVLTGYLKMNLKDDHFTKHLCVANGFNVKAPGSTDDFEDVEKFLNENPLEGSFISEIPPELLDE